MIKDSGILSINKKNLIYNYNFFKQLDRKLIVASTVKANAYGLGDKKIFKLLIKCGCKHFFVSTLSEGINLKNQNNNIKIYVLNGLQNHNLNLFSKAKLIPVINSFDEYKRIKKSNLKYAIHIDTGMNRLGMSVEDVNKLDNKCKNIKLIMSHLSSSDENNNKYNTKQKKIFNELVRKFDSEIVYSLANSHGAILNKSYLYNMIRPGIGIFGCYENSKLSKKVKNVLTLKGKVLQIKYINKNQYVGYNRTYKTKKKIKAAIIGLGYEDGISRKLSNKGTVYFKKYTFKIIGRISMDLFTIDISKKGHDLKIGMYVDIFNDVNKINKFAKKCETISYEILTSIGDRVLRKYE